MLEKILLDFYFYFFVFSVARLQCGPSQFMRFSNHVLNSPTSAALQQDDNRISQLFKTKPEEQNMRVINEGKLAYDKYGLPVDTTKAVVATENGYHLLKFLNACIFCYKEILKLNI